MQVFSSRPSFRTYLSSDLGQIGPQGLVPSVEFLVFGREADDGPLQLLDHRLFPFPRFAGANAVLF